MITREQREKDKAVCDAATPGPLEVDAEESIVWQRGPCAGEGAAVATTEEMGDAVFFVRAREALPAYIADAEEMERRIAKVEAMATGWAGSAETYTSKSEHDHAAICRAKSSVLQEALRILRGAT